VSHPAYLREKARSLRVEKGLTIDELAERLALPRTTIFYWVRDLPITHRTARQTAAQQRRASNNSARYRERREAAYAEGVASFADLAQDPSFCDFVSLYIAEGYKRSRNSVSICNSDAAVIVLATSWIRQLTDHNIDYSVQYHADQDVDELRTFWSTTLGIDGSVIRFQPKSNSGQLRNRTWRCEHGVIAVSAHDTFFRSRLQAWMDLTREAWLTLAPQRTGRGAAW
jgi:transcriptional regulator with XRE-family HTH domain